MSAQDPFYLVKEEIEDLVRKLKDDHQKLEVSSSSDKSKQTALTELISSCNSISWQLDELLRAIAVAEKDPKRFQVDRGEIERRRRWTKTTLNDIQTIKKSLEGAKEKAASFAKETARRELMRFPESNGSRAPRAHDHITRENDEFVASEDDRQALIIRVQDQHLDDMSASLAKIGSMGILIHDELGDQDKLLDDIHGEMQSTGTRMAVVQKKMQQFMTKAGVKGQICMIVSLVVLLLILIVLVVYT